MEIAQAYAGKLCIVCGCFSGMGAATARALVGAGAEVHGLDVRGEGPPGVKMSMLDLRDAAAIDAAAKALPDGIDALFVAAGLPGTFDPVDVVTVNFFGARQFIEAVAPKMVRGGAIATVASAAGNGWMQNLENVQLMLEAKSIEAGRRLYADKGEALGDAYSISKQALVAYTILEAPRMIEAGVRLNTLSPGMTDTPMLPEFRKANAAAMAAVPVPIGRASSADEQAVGLLMLNHPEATYLVGANLANDGGMVPAIMAQRLAPAPAAA